MGNLLFRTNSSTEGPWLLDEESLIKLDTIVDKNWDKLEARRALLLEKAVQSEYQKYQEMYKENNLPVDLQKHLERFQTYHSYAGSSRMIQIGVDDDTSFPCVSFGSAMNAIQLVKRNPISFFLNIESGDIRCEVSLDKYEGLNIKTSPDNVDEAISLYVDLQKWAEEYEPNWFKKIWGKLADNYIKFYIILLSIFFFSSFLVRQQDSSILGRIQDIQKVGVTDANVFEAVDLLLQLQVGTTSFPNWFIFLFIVCVLVGLILPIRPRVVLGIGNGVKRLRQWKWWYRFLSATVMLILTSLLIPQIIEFITRFLSS